MSLASKEITAFIFTGAAIPLSTALAALPRQDSGQQPDKTKTNKRDRDKTAPTADQQKMDATDRDLAKRIRASIADDKSLSTYAHNTEIVAKTAK
jgi:hypothetical protein